ncbi:coronin [Rhizoctonia solani]|uniref:Coronin n=1 Tax=Rhizoctonia solani TaxID=456999 RepID=A0A8H7H5V5_9AGAM|nr:coronin [Rhizoctonia solani]KAF8677345.1 WD repeat coronin family [Rhizoctonia solani]QRW16797.1 coronin [Rhizoctonia solani]
MSRFVRPSKYRHVFGQSAKKEWCIENVKVSNSAWDTNLISASASYVALNWNSSGGGVFAILPVASPFRPLPHNFPCKLPGIIPLARGHSAPVLDTDWSPFNDSVVASGGEDGRVLIWKVEESQFENWGAEKWRPRDFDPVATITGSGRKVGQVLFHPTAENVLASSTVGDGTVRLWDLADTNEAKIALTGHTDTIQSLTWNPTGTLLATTCRDRKIRLFDPRAGSEAVRIGDGHAGIKGARVVWLGGHDRIATTGFSKISGRQLALWDTSSLANIKTVSIDQSSGVIMPFWSDNNVLFLAGKGDGNIRSYEYENDNLYELSEYKSIDPQRGMCFLPRRALSVSDCEIMRVYKVYGSTIEPIGFVVPRKSDQFQSDIFPPAPSSEPALTAAEWFAGKTAPQNLVDLDTGAVSAASFSVPAIFAPQPTPAAAAPPPAATPNPVDPASIPLPPTPATAQTPVPTEVASPSNEANSILAEENARLASELREARARIVGLELGVVQPPPRNPPQPLGPEIKTVGTGSSRIVHGRPTTIPMPGRALLHDGKALAYPAQYECNQCHLTGYVAYDPSNPCRECWSLFAQPYKEVLSFAPWDSPESVTSDEQNLQRPLPLSSSLRPQPRPQPPSASPSHSQHSFHGPGQPFGSSFPTGWSSSSNLRPSVTVCRGGPPPGALIVRPGDSRIGGTVCLKCSGNGWQYIMLKLATKTCSACDGLGRLF